MTEYFVWNASPEIVSIGPVVLRYYSLLFMFAVLLNMKLSYKIIEREGYRIDDGAFLYIFPSVLIGARLGHVLFYSPGHYFSDPISILKVWEGGLASHGAFVGVCIAIVIYSWRHKLPIRLLMEVVMAFMGSVFLVRIGNFFNSEIIGRPTDVPWAVVFERVDSIPRHPAQLYEAAGYLIVLVIVLVMYFRFNIKPGKLVLLRTSMLGAFSVRFFAEFFKENQVAFESGMTLNMGQWLSLPPILVLLGLFFYKVPPLPASVFVSSADSKGGKERPANKNSTQQPRKNDKKKAKK